MSIDAQVSHILGLSEVNQIGIVVRDIDKARRNFSEFFKIDFAEVVILKYFNKIYRGNPSDFRMKMAFAMMGNLQIELIQDLEGGTIYQEFLEKRGEGLHHLGFVVTNLDERVAALDKCGIGVLMSGERIGVRFAYMDTENIVGLIVEFIERNEDALKK